MSTFIVNKLHLEITTRCVLECPGCPRTWFSKTLQRKMPNLDLDLDLLEKFLDCEIGRTVDTFQIESNHGDCIYYPKLLDFIRHWRSRKKFELVTNGSRRRSDFWHQLNSLMTSQDVITFSIDGLEHNNHLYRINSDWNSIMDGLTIMISGPAKIIWKTIIFSHNQDQIDEIKTMALDMGVDEFKLIKTGRFGEDRFRPDEHLIDMSRVYEKSLQRQTISPKCASIHAPFITPDGYCWPCCWMASYFTLHKTDMWRNRHLFDMKTCTMEQVINNISLFADTIRSAPERAHSVCKMHCGNIDDFDHTTL